MTRAILSLDPFPFPDPDAILKAEIASIAETLDAHRKTAQVDHPDITLTESYNVLEKLRAGAVLTPRYEDIKTRALVLILRELHDELDAAMLRAYGWPQGLSDEDILTRHVAINKERAAEEENRLVRWLRPDYQIPRFGTAQHKAAKDELDLVAPEDKGKPSFPTDERRRTAAIFAVLAGALGPLSPSEVASRFRQGRKIEREVALTLKAFMRYGDLASSDGGRTFLLRRVA